MNRRDGEGGSRGNTPKQTEAPYETICRARRPAPLPRPRQIRKGTRRRYEKEIEKQREVAYCPATTTWLANASSPSTDTRYCCPGTIDWPPWSGWTMWRLNPSVMVPLEPSVADAPAVRLYPPLASAATHASA